MYKQTQLNFFMNIVVFIQMNIGALYALKWYMSFDERPWVSLVPAIIAFSMFFVPFIWMHICNKEQKEISEIEEQRDRLERAAYELMAEVSDLKHKLDEKGLNS